MPSRFPIDERGGGWWLVCLMVILHVALFITSFGIFITLSVMDSLNAAQYQTADFPLLIAFFVLTILYAVVGCVTFLSLKPLWGRVLAVGSFFLILLYFTILLSLTHRNILCGIEHNDKEDLEVTFNESRIANCTWDSFPCILSFPDTVMETCPAVRHFWKHVRTIEKDEQGGVFVNRMVGGDIVYNILLLVVVFLSLRLSMVLGVEEAVVLPPTAGFRSSTFSSSFSRVPLTDIV